MKADEKIYEEAYQDKKKDQLDVVYVSKEVICCNDLPTLVDMPETLTCQICGKNYMNLVTGVRKAYIGILTTDKTYT